MIIRQLGFLACLAVVACSSGGKFAIQTSAKPAGLPPTPSLRVVVTGSAPESDAVLADARSDIVAQLIASGKFSQVVVANQPTDLVLSADIDKYSKVSVGERLLVGALAGRNRVGLNIRLTQAATGAAIETYRADGESAAHPLSSESGLSDAVREAAKQVAAGVQF